MTSHVGTAGIKTYRKDNFIPVWIKEYISKQVLLFVKCADYIFTPMAGGSGHVCGEGGILSESRKRQKTGSLGEFK